MKNREYSKCKIACSIPPIYWSTGIQFSIDLLEKPVLEFRGSQNLKKYQDESKKVSSVSVSLIAFIPVS